MTVRINKLHPERVDPITGSFSITDAAFAKHLLGKGPWPTLQAFMESEAGEYAMAEIEHKFYAKFGLPFHRRDLTLTAVEGAIVRAAYRRSNGANYVLAKDFLTDFYKLSLANIRFCDLPQDLTGYMYLPVPIIDSDGEAYHHCYFIAGSSEKYISVKNHGGRDNTGEFVLLNLISERGFEWTCRTMVPTDGNQLLATWFEGGPSRLDLLGHSAVREIEQAVRRSLSPFRGELAEPM